MVLNRFLGESEMNTRISRTATPPALFAGVAVALALGAPVSAEEIQRSNWLPNVGSLQEDEQPLGDMWTFRCPRGGSATVFVDTKDDTDTGESEVDPILYVVDGNGTVLASADDNATCTYPPVCGFQCPEVTSVRCGEEDKNNRHGIIVRDFGTATTGDTFCEEGGGYNLVVEVLDADGNQVRERAVRLGGGPDRKVPRWALALGKAPVGPALDDEDVPSPSELFEMDSADGVQFFGVTPDEKIPGQ